MKPDNKLVAINPFSESPESSDQPAKPGSSQAYQRKVMPEFTHDLNQQMINDLPSSLLGVLTGHPGEVTYLWLEKHLQDIQHALSYITSEYQFRLLGFVPSALLLRLLLDQDSDRRSRLFEWCQRHASARTTRKMVQIKKDTDVWISDCERRLALFGAPGAPGFYQTQAAREHQEIPKKGQDGH